MREYEDEFVIETYKGEDAYHQGIEEMTEDGWEVVNVMDQGRPAIGAFLWGSLVKRKYLVTYRWKGRKG